jgi:HEPN domain-containing protein
MTREEKYAYWLELSQYDLDTAQAMYVGGRWFYVVYMCQQAIEKLCKGLYGFYIDDNVPKVHNIRFILTKIETSLSLTVDPELYKLADTLSAYYLNNRYPDFAGKASIYLDRDIATDLL